MDLQFYGANCVRITTKKATIVIDDTLSELGLKAITKPDDINLFTHPKPDNILGRLSIDSPGEYEVSDTSIQGIAARSHIDESDSQTTTIFKIIGEDIRVVVLGHAFPELNDIQLEALGTIDILILPVGGNGYTLDGVEALKMIKKIEPKLVIPTHYADKTVKYEVPQSSLEDALKDLAMEPKETVPKLKLKPSDIPLDMQLIVLERQ